MKQIKKYLSVKNGKDIKSTDDFIIRAKEVHGEKYNYSKTIFKSMKQKDKMIIECSIHGKFEQGAYSHLSGKGCHYCAQNKHTQKSIIEKLNKIHPTLDFSKVIYKNITEKIPVRCTKCNTNFNPCIRNLIHNKSGCPKCGNSLKRTTEEYINECEYLYGSFFKYDGLVYKSIHKNVSIFCIKHNKKFEISASTHLRHGTGCDECKKEKNVSLNALIIDNELKKYKIKFIKEYKFTECKNINPLPFDFYLPEYNTCIEYDGKQHFKSVERWGGDDGLEFRKKKDQIKDQYCKDNNIKLIRISYKFNRKLKTKLYDELQKMNILD